MIDKETFCVLIKEYEKSIYYVAYSIVKNDVDAEEIISEAIYKAYTRLDTLKDKNAFKTWMLRIVHNTGVDYIKKNSKKILMDEQIEQEVSSREEDIVNKMIVQNAVNQLKQPYRTVILLYYYEEMSIKEISQITSTNAITVRKQLSRGRTMLKEILKGGMSNE